MAKIAKARYWVAVLYPESMDPDWSDDLDFKLQVPYCFCIHDKDLTSDCEEDRKVHVHLILAFNNTTTYNHALSIFQKLQPTCKYCEQVLNIRFMYNYLIHDTSDCKKKNKHVYSISERICGNNFDIGSYEQISISDKRKMLKDLCDFIYKNNICNFIDFYESFLNEFDSEYFEVISTYSGLLERLCKGNYLKTLMN